MNRARVRRTVGYSFLAIAVAVPAVWALHETRRFHREVGYAIGYSRLAEVPTEARTLTLKESGWHSLEIKFRAPPAAIQEWISASPALRAVTPARDADGAAVFRYSVPETEDSTVRVSRDGRVVEISVFIPMHPPANETEL